MTSAISSSPIRPNAAPMAAKDAFNVPAAANQTLVAQVPPTIVKKATEKSAVSLERQFAIEAAKRAEASLGSKILKLALPLVKFTKAIPVVGTIVTVVSELGFAEPLATEPDTRAKKFTPPKPLIGTEPAFGDPSKSSKLTNPNSKAKAPSAKTDIGTQLDILRKSIPHEIFKNETPEAESKRTGRKVEEIIEERTANARVHGYQNHMNEMRDTAIKNLVKTLKAAPANEVVSWFNKLKSQEKTKLRQIKEIINIVNEKLAALRIENIVAKIKAQNPDKTTAAYNRLSPSQRNALHPDIRRAYEPTPSERVYRLSPKAAAQEYSTYTQPQKDAMNASLKQAYYGKIIFGLDRYSNQPGHNTPIGF
jgi:uncharacterized protein YbjQ (UPF0145 family)